MCLTQAFNSLQIKHPLKVSLLQTLQIKLEFYRHIPFCVHVYVCVCIYGMHTHNILYSSVWYKVIVLICWCLVYIPQYICWTKCTQFRAWMHNILNVTSVWLHCSERTHMVYYFRFFSVFCQLEQFVNRCISLK